MPPDPSVTSASVRLRRCTLRYSSALLPKSLERPGPKSVSPATYCSGVSLVVWWRWIVDMRTPFFSVLSQLSQQPGEVHLRIAGLEAALHRGLVPLLDLGVWALLEEKIGIATD